MNKIIICLLLSIGAGVCLSACSSISPQMEVVSRFTELKKAGELPGFMPDDHGTLKTQGFRIGQQLRFPASMTVYAKNEDEPDRYIYTFRKENDLSEWDLIEAWRELPDGKREDLIDE